MVGRQRERGLQMRLEEFGVPSVLSAHLVEHLEQPAAQRLQRAMAPRCARMFCLKEGSAQEDVAQTRQEWQDLPAKRKQHAQKAGPSHP